jgi:hypothetical protein
MKSRLAILAVTGLFGGFFLSAPAHLHGQQTSATQEHEQHHPGPAAEQPPSTGDQHANMMNMMARMKAADQKIDGLVKKMNAARGSAKTDAIAELLTALVADRTECESMMANMMSMKTMMGGHCGHDQAAPTNPQK